MPRCTSRCAGSPRCRRSSTEAAVGEIAHRLLDFLATVHDEGAVARDRLLERPAGGQDEARSGIAGCGGDRITMREHRQLATRDGAAGDVEAALVDVHERVV